MNKEDIVENVKSILRHATRSLLPDVRRKPNYLEHVADSVRKALLPMTASLAPWRDVKVEASDDPTVVRCRFKVTAPELAAMAHQLYGDGQTHEQVTEWLEKGCPTFRDHLAEILHEDKKYWVVRPTMVTVILDGADDD